MTHRLLIFDLDGTLIDSFKAIHASLVHAMERFGFEPWEFEKTKRHVGWGLELLVRDAIGEENVEGGVRTFREHYPKVCLELSELLPGVKPGIEALQERGYLLAVATNKPSTFTRMILDNLGMESCFVEILGPNDVSKPKPDPVMIRTILDRIGVSAEEALYIGDMPLDVESGRNAGVKTLLVATGTYSAEELATDGVTVLNSFEEITNYLEMEDA